jgi:hypothetical protein
MAADQLPQGVYMYCDRPLGGYRSIVAMHRKIAKPSHERIVAPCYNASRRYAMDEATFDTRFHPCRHTVLTQFCYHVLRTLGRISCEAAFSYPQLVRALYDCGTGWRAQCAHEPGGRHSSYMPSIHEPKSKYTARMPASYTSGSGFGFSMSYVT